MSEHGDRVVVLDLGVARRSSSWNGEPPIAGLKLKPSTTACYGFVVVGR